MLQQQLNSSNILSHNNLSHNNSSTHTPSRNSNHIRTHIHKQHLSHLSSKLRD